MPIIRNRETESVAERTAGSRRNMLCIIRAKACKRCGGDLSVECDIYGVYIQCIQCGATWNKADLAVPGAREIKNSLKAIKVNKSTTAGKPG
jgi:hypothetical protein